MTDFFKFPTTPHIAVLSEASVRVDKVLTDREREDFLAKEIIVEEKVDGANLGLSFDEHGNINLQSRGDYLQPPYRGQWGPIDTWMAGKLEPLFDHLGRRLILFGEWCYARHSVYYSLLPDWFLAFDVFDKSERRFWSVERRNALAKECRISAVPELARGFFTLPKLERLLARSRVSQEWAEGLYLRRDEGGWLKGRAKLVRPLFMQSVDKHWSHFHVEPNRLTPEPGA
jgi:ATP-dependent RNA circularization protein (DNA/RNA ligase family)